MAEQHQLDLNSGELCDDPGHKGDYVSPSSGSGLPHQGSACLQLSHCRGRTGEKPIGELPSGRIHKYQKRKFPICYFPNEIVEYSFEQEAFPRKVWKLGLDMKDKCDRDAVEKMVKDLMEARKGDFIGVANEMGKLARKSMGEGRREGKFGYKGDEKVNMAENELSG
ncbi:hypothetical protein RJ639_035082 [Escallonia herrerae]|uniref:Uncharacterized protein n=1 Tax=Escallonia herrerae TaxID=1293975 RepID=A0AA89BGF8_9ASTE|nr:hypothetical protein RJ639_035082 [Escallonia herrerae]